MSFISGINLLNYPTSVFTVKNTFFIFSKIILHLFIQRYVMNILPEIYFTSACIDLSTILLKYRLIYAFSEEFALCGR